MSRWPWALAGALNLLAGVAIAALRWPMWAVQVPADALFVAVPLIGAANLVAAIWPGRCPTLWLTTALLAANMVGGTTIALFAAWQFESPWAGLLGLALGVVPSALALWRGPARHGP